MSEELLKQLLRKMSSLESRVQFIENGSLFNGNPDPSYWQRAMSDQIVNQGYQPFESDLPVRMPPKER